MNEIVRNYLIEVARQTNKTTTYLEVSQKCNLGLNYDNPADRDKIGKILDDI